MSRACSSAGNSIPAECRVIEVRVAELRQLFNAIDPSPFRDRDSTPVRNISSSNGPASSLVPHGWRCWSTSSAVPGRRMRRRCLAIRSIITSGQALRGTRRLRRAVSARPHQPGDRARVPGRIIAPGDAVATFPRTLGFAMTVRAF